MVEINGKSYELVELSARKYKALMARMEKDFGENWQSKGGIDLGVIMLASSLKSADGVSPSEDDLWDLPMRRLNELTAEATKLNGMDSKSEAAAEKN